MHGNYCWCAADRSVARRRYRTNPSYNLSRMSNPVQTDAAVTEVLHNMPAASGSGQIGSDAQRWLVACIRKSVSAVLIVGSRRYRVVESALYIRRPPRAKYY